MSKSRRTDEAVTLRNRRRNERPSNVLSIVLGVLLFLGLAFWAASGIYFVNFNQTGLVTRFGKLVDKVGPGVHYHLPFPIEHVEHVDKEAFQVKTIEYVPRYQYANPPYENQGILLLSSDNNLIRVSAVVQYKIRDAASESLKVANTADIIYQTGKAVIRERIANHTAREALAGNRSDIAREIHELLQSSLEAYGAGIEIVNVRLQNVVPPTEKSAMAFDDVNAAVQDAERAKFEAMRACQTGLRQTLDEDVQLSAALVKRVSACPSANADLSSLNGE